MPSELGPAARTLVEGAAVAHAARDAAEATLLLKRLAGSGLRFVDLAPPEVRAEANAIALGVMARTKTRFAAWVAKHGAPMAEVERALMRFEANGAKHLAACARVMRPAATSEETAMQLFLAVADCDPVYRDDIIVRDIGWALARAAFEAARDYDAALATLTPKLTR